MKGPFGCGELHYQQTDQDYPREQDRQPDHAVVHYEGGATAFLPVGYGRPRF